MITENFLLFFKQIVGNLLKNREYKEKPLKEYLDEITFVDKSWI